jgi:hypothetical protein
MTNRMPWSAAHLLCVALCAALAGCGAAPLEIGDDEPIFDTELDQQPAELDGLFLVIDAAGPLLVVDRDPDPDWAIGPVERLPQADSSAWSVTRRGVDPSKLPADLADVSRQQVRFSGPDGRACLAALGALELVGRTDSADHEPSDVSGDDGDGLDLDPSWESPSSRVVLGSRLRSVDGSCAGTTWATYADAPAPLVFARVEREELEGAEQLAGAALEALRQLPEYRELEALYAVELELDERAERWEEHGGASPSFAFWRAGDRTLVGVDLGVGGGCGDFGAALWALFELRDGSLLLRARDREAPFPTDVFDLEGDGRLELASGERLLLPTQSGVAVLDVDVPYYGCSC